MRWPVVVALGRSRRNWHTSDCTIAPQAVQGKVLQLVSVCSSWNTAVVNVLHGHRIPNTIVSPPKLHKLKLTARQLDLCVVWPTFLKELDAKFGSLALDSGEPVVETLIDVHFRSQDDFCNAVSIVPGSTCGLGEFNRTR